MYTLTLLLSVLLPAEALPRPVFCGPLPAPRFTRACPCGPNCQCGLGAACDCALHGARPLFPPALPYCPAGCPTCPAADSPWRTW